MTLPGIFPTWLGDYGDGGGPGETIIVDSFSAIVEEELASSSIIEDEIEATVELELDGAVEDDVSATVDDDISGEVS
ncbi:MAG: hypothetical protein AMS19_02525 [Gemmatimonas sp. SG8_23]|jgi:hypothetical protein|nr:MAG: hypothetical protein AMS19_02525 [Gemmatimonas sp. SG8_23]